jgi:hypothetical protein
MVWKEDFVSVPSYGRAAIPEGWVLRKKPGTKSAIFSAMKDPQRGLSFLRMKADSASASLITRLDGIDIKKTPLLKWRWRATRLPNGADGRVESKDDQAIGIYIGSGSPLNNKSVSYRWDTETPKGAKGSSAYGLGWIKVKWFTLRNKKDCKKGRWFTEERNVAEDFKDAWGFYPATVYLSISCNSQYTGSTASAELNWIELTAK